MFQSMKNINSAFNYVRLFSLIIVLASFLISFYAIVKVSEISKMSKEQMLVLDATGNIQTATLSSRTANIKAESKAHLKRFHKLFFEFDPEQDVIDANKERWSYLADKSAVVQFDKMTEMGFFQNIIAGSISSRLHIDEILLEKSEEGPFYNFQLKGRQTLLRSSSVANRNVITSGRLRILNSRTENNPHGLMIVNWQIVDNSTISTGKRYD